MGTDVVRPGGEDEEVTLDNLDDYIESLCDFVLHSGIQRQLQAMKQGFSTVFPVEKLAIFTPDEVHVDAAP